MENTQVKETRINTGECATGNPRSRTRFYTKVEDHLYDFFADKEINPLSRLVYGALSASMTYNSSFAKATYNDLIRKTGIGSRHTIKASLDELSKKGFISRMDTSTYRLWHGVFKGIREGKNGSALSAPDSRNSSALSAPPHASVMINKTIKKQLLPKSDGSGSSFFSKLSETKMTLAKRYVDLLQQNGTEIRGFTIYVERVCEKSEKFGTWEKLEQNVKSLEDKIAEKETDCLENEISKENNRKRLENENSENKAKKIRVTQVLEDIAWLSLKEQKMLRIRAQDRLSESNQWMEDKIKSCSNKSDRIIQNMVKNEMVEIYQDENSLECYGIK